MIEDKEWEESEISSAKEFLDAGYLVWFRPHMTNVSKHEPERDPIWVANVQAG